MAESSMGVRFKGSYVAFFALLLSVYVLYPLFLERGSIVARILFYVVLMFGVGVARAPKPYIILCSLLGILGLAVRFIPGIGRTAQLAAIVTNFVLLCLVFGQILRHVVREKRVTMDLIFGSVCAYFLLGLTWAFGLGIVEWFNPGGFNYPDTLRAAQEGLQLADEKFSYLFYYSYTTLTTLGYGDITPRTPFTQVLATLEAFTGQLFLTILVAHLVSLRITQRYEESDSSSPSESS